MDQSHSQIHSPSRGPRSSSKHHHPYFTLAEIEHLAEKQRSKISVAQEEKVRNSACSFIEAVGARVGFPRKTIATAQNLYHRLHLFFSRKDFSYHDVSLAALYVSNKMHDTLKKPRELLAVSYAIRYPELVAKSKGIAGEIDIDIVDQTLVEQDRQRLLAIERLILETICFNFTSRMPFPYVIKIGKAIGASQKLTKLAWRLTVDSYRTLVPLQFPPHTLALGCIYGAALLSSFEQQSPSERPERPGILTNAQVVELLSSPGSWQDRFRARVEDLEEIVHGMLDLLIQATQNHTANTSPSTPSSPSPHPSRNPQPQPQAPPLPYKSDQLMRLKIAIRETERGPQTREPLSTADPSTLYRGDEAALVGKNEGTVRFLFGPPRVVGHGV